MIKRGFTHSQVDKHIKEIRHRFGFEVRRSRRGKHIPPTTLPEIIFTEEKGRAVPTTRGAKISTTSNATPSTPSTSELIPPMGTGAKTTEIMEQTIGRITIADPGDAPGERGHMPIISTIFSLSTPGGTEEPGEQQMELECVSTVTKDFE